MSVKAPRGLTHAKKLYSPEVWVDRIAASWHELYDRRAVLLVQLPLTLERDDERLGWFLDWLPWWVPVAVEMRHPSWHEEEVFDLLARHRASYCVMSGAGLPCVLRSTAPFVYVRLHGPSQDWLYGGSYSDDDLVWWADRLREWEGAGQEVCAYFNKRRRRKRGAQRRRRKRGAQRPAATRTAGMLKHEELGHLRPSAAIAHLKQASQRPLWGTAWHSYDCMREYALCDES
jgi:uncharacterized protein YecE (DUF72 family)